MEDVHVVVFLQSDLTIGIVIHPLALFEAHRFPLIVEFAAGHVHPFRLQRAPLAEQFREGLASVFDVRHFGHQFAGFEEKLELA